MELTTENNPSLKLSIPTRILISYLQAKDESRKKKDDDVKKEVRLSQSLRVLSMDTDSSRDYGFSCLSSKLRRWAVTSFCMQLEIN